jgi:uncharacterized protein (TIGR02231 family)
MESITVMHLTVKLKFMKLTTLKFIVLLPILCFADPANAQTEKLVNSKISEVTVFLNNAQVTRDVKAGVEAGKTSIVLTGLTAQLDHESIQVSGKGAFVLLGVTHQLNYLNELNLPLSLKTLKDSIIYFQKKIAFEQSQNEILGKEEQMLQSNQKIGGTNQNLTASELKTMADFYRSRLREIALARMNGDERIEAMNNQLSKVQRQLAEQNDLYSRNTSEIVISVSAEVPTSVELHVKYIVANAGWEPVYDLRAVDTKSPIQLNYKANVYQRTGELWKNVHLTLSTANPNLSGLKPELYPWYLNFYQAMYYDKKDKASLSGKIYGIRAPATQAEDAKEVLATTTADFVSTIQTTLSAVFSIGLPYTIESSNKPTQVDIRKYEMKADYLYAVAPKLDPQAFLLAKATGWEEFNLLPGDANIFFEGTFVGKSYIDPNVIKDTLSVSLGRDKRIVVKREKLKDFSTRKFIGTNQRDSYAYELSIRNTKNEPVRIVIEDQVPVSQNNQIEITITDVGGATYNKDTGKLMWDITLSPSEAKKVSYKFEVKYPKDRQIEGL